MKILRTGGVLLLGVSLAWACGFEGGVREYLTARFWLPFSKRAGDFAKNNIQRASAPYAGMTRVQSRETNLARLRAEYQRISQPISYALPNDAELRQALNAARADATLNLRDREEVELIDAKIDIRTGQPTQPEPLLSAKQKLFAYLRTAQTPEFLSEARGWLAYTHRLLGEQTEAGKIYLDELNRSGSNLSRETLLNSLAITYGSDGSRILEHLEEYFDTPEHALFAVQMVTNPGDISPAYGRVRDLLNKNTNLLASENGANALALLAMRTALRMGDPAEAIRLADMVPAGAALSREPDFHWMLASSYFLSRDYVGAERHLLDLFESPLSSGDQKAAAAYGLCGVYWKTKDAVEQLRFALWLRHAWSENDIGRLSGESPVYWAVSGWDLNLVLDAEAPIAALQAFVAKYPNDSELRLVKYALAVRLTRENRYDEAARLYESIRAVVRAPRLRRLAELYREANGDNLEAKYNLAEFLNANPNRIYFNDSLWEGFQNAALYGAADPRLTREEHDALSAGERKLRDDQEERWRAYQILREIISKTGKTEMGRKSAQLALRSLRGINPRRFGRGEEIRNADIELTRWLR